MRFAIIDETSGIDFSYLQLCRFDFVGMATPSGQINMLKNRADDRRFFANLKEFLDFVDVYYQTNEIQKKQIELNELIEKYVSELDELRESCSHPHATRIVKSNSGNYDPSADAYWYDCKCPDCGKRWQEDQ